MGSFEGLAEVHHPLSSNLLCDPSTLRASCGSTLEALPWKLGLVLTYENVCAMRAAVLRDRSFRRLKLLQAKQLTEVAKKESEAVKRDVVKDELARKKAKPTTCEEAMEAE